MSTKDFIAGLGLWGGGVLLGMWIAYTMFYQLPTHRINVAMEACGYEPHPISDVAWELYARSPDRYRLGAAWFFTGRLRSTNLGPADCMAHSLDPDYAIEHGYATGKGSR